MAETAFLHKKFGDRTTYGINRFMIDMKHQGRGFGKQALLKVIEYIRSFPQGKADAISVSYWKMNETARRLFASVGFTPTGAIWDGQTGDEWDMGRDDVEDAEVGARIGL